MAKKQEKIYIGDLLEEIMQYRKKMKGRCLSTTHTLSYQEFKILQDHLVKEFGGFMVIVSKDIVHLELKMS